MFFSRCLARSSGDIFAVSSRNFFKAEAPSENVNISLDTRKIDYAHQAEIWGNSTLCCLTFHLVHFLHAFYRNRFGKSSRKISTGRIILVTNLNIYSHNMFSWCARSLLYSPKVILSLLLATACSRAMVPQELTAVCFKK